MSCTNHKDKIKIHISKILNFIKNAKITSCDFYKLQKKLGHLKKYNHRMLVYCDPPYCNTKQEYSTERWTIKNFEDLIVWATKKKFKIAISELNNPDILQICKKYKLNIIPICTRKVCKKILKEILITNYELDQPTKKSNP
jgi:site-specific DNA-adenine methylase